MHHSGTIINQKEGIDVIECTNCGFRHINPLPTPQQLKHFYQEAFYGEEKPDYFRHYEEDSDWWQIIYQDRLQQLADLMQSSLPRTLLDVGSGPGLFLLEAEAQGWQAQGIEPSRQAVDYSRNRGAHVHHAFFDNESANTIGRHSVVHLSEVLEHIPDPGALLQLTHQVIEPEGLLCIMVPNDYSPIQQILQADDFEPWWVVPNHHLNYFSRSSLTALVERNGFEVLHVTTTFPIDLFLLLGDDYIHQPELGRQCHGKRKRMERLIHAKGFDNFRRQWYQAMASADVGREIILYARLLR